MKELLKYIERSLPLSEEMAKDLKDISIVKNVKKGQLILQENPRRKIQIFVASGCLSWFYKTDQGKEHTLQFAIKNWWIGDYITLFKDIESMIRVESLSYSKIILFEHENLEQF